MASVAEGLAKDAPYAARKMIKHLVSMVDRVRSYQQREVVNAIYSAARNLSEWEQAEVGGDLFRTIQENDRDPYFRLYAYACAVALIGRHDGRGEKEPAEV